MTGARKPDSNQDCEFACARGRLWYHDGQFWIVPDDPVAQFRAIASAPEAIFVRSMLTDDGRVGQPQ